MRTKNAAAITPAEREHLRLVKLCACGWCDKAGGFAHHTKQGNHFTTIGTCWDCHQGPMGWHGDRTLMRIYKRDENDALNGTLRRVDELKRRGA
jgi:hypothetical protein